MRILITRSTPRSTLHDASAMRYIETMMRISSALVVACLLAASCVGVFQSDDMSTTQLQPGGGSRPPSLATVATDQSTIRGSGGSDNPLHAPGATPTLKLPSVNASAVPGRPIAPFTGDASRASAGLVNIAGIAGATCIGVAIGIDAETGDVEVQATGVVDLPVAIWAAEVTGNPATGLTPGAIYYVSNLGKLTLTRPLSGDIVTQVGWAETPTRLVMQLSAPFLLP